MIYFIIGFGLFFIILGYILNEKNARYLLAGYNTLSSEARKDIDIKAYLMFFRRFHLILGVSFILIGGILVFFFNEVVVGAFVTIYPCLAYIYLAIKGAKFSAK